MIDLREFIASGVESGASYSLLTIDKISDSFLDSLRLEGYTCKRIKSNNIIIRKNDED